MNKKRKNYSDIFNALSDLSRLEIVEILSNGELCACKILEKFKITQPTLSHHMKILCQNNIVKSRKDGKWMFYSLNLETMDDLVLFIQEIIANKN